jgi:hypothetical protein
VGAREASELASKGSKRREIKNAMAERINRFSKKASICGLYLKDLTSNATALAEKLPKQGAGDEAKYKVSASKMMEQKMSDEPMPALADCEQIPRAAGKKRREKRRLFRVEWFDLRSPDGL